MGKSEDQVIQEFNEYVNMTAEELQDWLETDESKGAGWNGDSSGETTGHQSGRKIVEILKKNPDKDPEKYDQDDLAHMRKVAAYCSRHLKQEAHLAENKTQDELEQTKSWKSLMNWGHREESKK
ncbi:hypothetical protein OIO90_006277 [Microbotryomycetes sp. JL221]|nr:hypothetical protein OIO90_006277 [Microbotryomycetes sp. JL221]